MSAALDAFDIAVNRLGERYEMTIFYTERDLVFWVQTEMVSVLATRQPTLRVFNDYKMADRLRADLAVVDTATDTVLLAVEFKYEPDRARDDIPAGKFPVTAWSEIKRDIERVRAFVTSGQASEGVAVLIDEDWRYHDAASQCFDARIDLGAAGTPGSAGTAWVSRSLRGTGPAAH